MSDFANMRPPVFVSMRRVNVGMRKINSAPELFHSYIKPKTSRPSVGSLKLICGCLVVDSVQMDEIFAQKFSADSVTGDILVLPFSSFYLAFIF